MVYALRHTTWVVFRLSGVSKTSKEDDVHPATKTMPSARPCLTLLIVFLSAFAFWEALSFLDSHVLQAEVETEHIVVYRKTPPRTAVYKDVTSGDESALDITTESSPSNEEGSATWMHAQEEKFNERRLRVETVCGKYKDVAWTNKYVGREFLFDLDNGLAYCRHGKARRHLLTMIITF